ncbi:MAG TPA: tetratricopeptide repeat-containing protein [Chitinophagaceae bacterium]|nr:tetratricopeptide repeat-containing protein [Chitinophagaceae bacterium]
MQAFIVRPFGLKGEIDFDKVDCELIQPALTQVGITGSTTAVIVEQGNIREDMFAQLLLADLVIADLSIHNANVFYELGIRHALRDKRTFLIRCSKDEIPFDLKTDRYLNYTADNPAAAIKALVDGLTATLLSEKADSPVFYMLPKLEAQDPERFLAVPQDFGEEVELARVSKQIGKLSLLALEAAGFPWELPAIRNIAEALYQSNDLEASGIFWEKVRKRYSNDIEANDRLATIYQRRAEDELKINRESAWELLTKSGQAIDRVLMNMSKLDSSKKAEMFSLKGRNAKVKWIDTWRNTAETEWKKEALKSTYLADAYEEYEKAYTEDLNHFYSGINALGLLSIIISLAEALPNIWMDEFDTEDDAMTQLKKHKVRHQNLAVMVQAAIDATRKRTSITDKPDYWLNITEADLACIISTKPARVSNLYDKVLQEAKGLTFDAARRQLILYKQLGVMPENVQAALTSFSKVDTEVKTKPHYILFTGHMLDKPDREEPRFPASKENNAREAIKQAVLGEKNKYGDSLKGIAGGACGGDILFHEVCAESGIKTELYLALPREEFIVSSVAFAGPQWIERFDNIYKRGEPRILSEGKELPKWLQKKTDYSIWVRNNLWMLNSALVCGGMQMTLIALWNGKGGDGEGGTAHMVEEAKSRGAKIIVIDATTL